MGLPFDTSPLKVQSCDNPDLTYDKSMRRAHGEAVAPPLNIRLKVVRTINRSVSPGDVALISYLHAAQILRCEPPPPIALRVRRISIQFGTCVYSSNLALHPSLLHRSRSRVLSVHTRISTKLHGCKPHAALLLLKGDSGKYSTE